MTESPALAALRRTTVFLKAFVNKYDIDVEETVIEVAVVSPSGAKREVATLNLGEVLREADTVIAGPPQPLDRRLS